MSEASLESVFGSEQPAEPLEPVAQEVQEPAEQATGEEVAATPAEPQDDPMERHRKGLEAAAVAERNKRQAAEARAQALEERIRQFEQQQQRQQPANTEGEPDPQDPRYQENPQAYWRDLARYEARQELKQQAEADKARQQQEEQDRVQLAFKERVQNVVEQGRTKFPDFDAVINSGLSPFLNPTMHQALGLSDNGHETAYWLGKNPAEAARISQLPPMLMVLELGRVAAKASAPAPAPIPRTLTDVRNAAGQFAARQSEITPLDAILTRNK